MPKWVIALPLLSAAVTVGVGLAAGFDFGACLPGKYADCSPAGALLIALPTAAAFGFALNVWFQRGR
jgi:hypothetical protein